MVSNTVKLASTVTNEDGSVTTYRDISAGYQDYTTTYPDGSYYTNWTTPEGSYYVDYYDANGNKIASDHVSYLKDDDYWLQNIEYEDGSYSYTSYYNDGSYHSNMGDGQGNYSSESYGKNADGLWQYEEKAGPYDFYREIYSDEGETIIKIQYGSEGVETTVDFYEDGSYSITDSYNYGSQTDASYFDADGVFTHQTITENHWDGSTVTEITAEDDGTYSAVVTKPDGTISDFYTINSDGNRVDYYEDGSYDITSENDQGRTIVTEYDADGNAGLVWEKTEDYYQTTYNTTLEDGTYAVIVETSWDIVETYYNTDGSIQEYRYNSEGVIDSEKASTSDGSYVATYYRNGEAVYTVTYTQYPNGASYYEKVRPDGTVIGIQQENVDGSKYGYEYDPEYGTAEFTENADGSGNGVIVYVDGRVENYVKADADSYWELVESL